MAAFTTAGPANSAKASSVKDTVKGKTSPVKTGPAKKL